ncbi:hypothetical protein TRSC58_07421 [Trypanosoma rangeli SC58]|uniref:EF-hand domain-containing protein n=1 Tax=Trypanosoma rangeli SC58 TaxID=429131 RepID=A0A061ISV3_TRYRA|nr:hypothetical protein TRSC58_07421 [Trypanosoma rangeli SC58]
MTANGLTEAVPVAELLEAFRAFDTRKVGWLPMSTVKALLDKFGDFSTAEMEEFILEAEQGGRMYYKKFVEEIASADVS